LIESTRMWSWDQGRLDYYQFDELKKLAKLALKDDLRHTDHATLGHIPIKGIPKRADL